MAECKNSPSSVLEFFMLVGKVKFLKRTGWVMRNIENCEHVAGHMFRMGIMAFLLDDASLNVDRCIKMALVHDIPECIVGDITPFCGVSKEEKHKREMEAMNKLCSLVREDIGKELLSLFTEYEEQNTFEAKSVKDLDKFDMLLQAYEYETDTKFTVDLQDFFDNTKGIQNETVLNWYQDLLHLRSKTTDSSLTSEVMKSKSNVFDFLLHIGKLKHLKSECWNLDGSLECDTVADHWYRTSIMAFLLNDNTSLDLNRDKCIKMGLVQNIMKSAGGISALDCSRNKEIDLLHMEYQAQQTPEAKVVKDLNVFENLLQAYEYNLKAGTKQHSLPASKHCFQNSEVTMWAKELQALEGKITMT